MALLHALVQVVVMLMYTKFTLQEVMLFRASKNLKIGKMLHLHDVRLNITAFAVEEFPNEMKCVTSCVKTDECYCVNVKEQANGVRCELLNRTIYHYPKYLTRDASSSHWFAEGITVCDPSPCHEYEICKKRKNPAQFTCFYNPNYNFALFKPTAQSSVFMSVPDIKFLSHYAVDGIKADTCRSPAPSCAHTSPQKSVWWRVDLQVEIPVARIVITNRKDYDNGLSNFELKIGNSLVNEGRDNPKCGDLHTVPHKGMKTIPCSPPMRGRYVLLQRNNKLVIIEVEVFAAEVEAGK